ncbi:MAG: cytochrome-c peroxidase [Gammaproteobacteria bacterium]
MRFLFILSFSAMTLLACNQDTAPKPATESPPTTISSKQSDNPLLGLPPVPVPADNPQFAGKIGLGGRLFHDKRFSIDGTVSCANCHNEKKAFTDGLQVSVGHSGKTGTRNAPTVINAAFYRFQFWDGREPDLESQSKQPFINPVEGGLKDHTPILEIIRAAPEYVEAFESVFGVTGDQITMDHVAKAIASFERTLVSGDSPFDRYYFKGEKSALTDAQIRGFKLFLGQGRCVSCHTIEQDHALFTDSRFHNIGIGINAIQQDVPRLVAAFLQAKAQGGEVDAMVLSDKKSSELGRFAVTDQITDIGAFKTPTLRNIELTAPYMHDGSLKTLKEVISHYNNGGVTPEGAEVNAFLSGGIRPLNLNDAQIDDLVAFMKALTSPQFAQNYADTASQ